MYISVLYLITICFLAAIAIKANKHKSEWLLLLIILSYVKTCISYLFAATTVFTVVTLGGTQIHLDDIVLIIGLLFCLATIIHPFRGGKYCLSTLLLLIPVAISLFRGAVAGSLGSAEFLSDTRKFFLFVVVFYAFFFLMRRIDSIERMWKYEQYLNNLMNCVLLYVLVVWILDLGLGINGLPGQKNGLLSDGGSTFRIINPPQVLIIAFYTLYQMYKDLENKHQFTIRTLIFAGVILLMQWRTVVAAFLVGVFILLVMNVKENGLSKKLFGEILGLIFAAIVISLQGGDSDGLVGMLSNLFESFSNVRKGTGTFATRTEAWTMILASLHGVNAIFGMPFGQDLNIAWKHSAHSGYVDYITKMGYFGVGCLIVFMVWLLIRAIKNKDYLSTIILCVQAVYWYGYGFTLEQGAVLGFILAIQEWREDNYLNGVAYAE